MLFIKHRHYFSFLAFPRGTPEKQAYRMRMIFQAASQQNETLSIVKIKKKINKINKFTYKYFLFISQQASR